MSRRRPAAAAFAVAVLLVAQAPPASAHAVLLRTVPSPQTTVATPPGAVRLVFSEPAEAVFGAVRVFDVDGRRVTTGEARHPSGNRSELAVGLPRIADGTYTVTWRVVSDDGHAVKGGFVFYVGAPSTISSAAVAGEGSAGAVVGWGGGVVRWVWYLAVAVLVGSVVVRRWVWTPAAAAAGAPESAAAFRRRLRGVMPAAWLVLAVAGAAGLAFQAAKVSGLPLLGAVRPSVLGEVLATSFGGLWAARMVITAVLGVPVVMLARRRMPPWLSPAGWTILGAALAGALVVTDALGGHARTGPNPAWATASVALHLGAVSVWVGGLLVLVGVGGPATVALPADRRGALLGQVLRRFSRVAVASVAVIVVTGVVNSAVELSSVGDLWRLAYGRTVVAKVVALGLALILGARHLWVVPRRLQAAEDDDGSAVRSFRWSSGAEVVVLLAALSLAAGLVDLVPGRAVALAAKGPVNQERRVRGYTVQLFVDPTQAGQNDLHVTFVDPSGLAAAEVADTEVDLAPGGAAAAPVRMRLLSPGHFVGEADLVAPGPYRLEVRAPGGSEPLSTTFTFRLSESLFKEKKR